MSGSKVPAQPEYLAVNMSSAIDDQIGVDREAARINGYIVAEVGDFKDGRGSFDEDSLEAIVRLGNQDPRGIKSRLGHPNQSDDKLTRHLGRSKNFRLDPDGQRVRADLHLAASSLIEPVGGGRPIGLHAMDRAEEDSGSLASSLVVKSTKSKRRDADNQPLPDHWLPDQLKYSDLVSEGDATHGDLLSPEGLDDYLEGSTRRLPSQLAVVATDYLNQLFPDADRDVVETRFNSFRDRYLSNRFGDVEPDPNPQVTDLMDQDTKNAIDELSKSFDEKLSALTELITTDREERKQAVAAEALAKDRATQISSLCELSGLTDKGEITQFINDDALSVSDVIGLLAKRKATANPPAADDALSEDGQQLTPEQLQAKADQKLREEYDALGFMPGECSFDEFKAMAAKRDQN
ncbi:MAG: hypothetical protein AAF539_08215 [Planctomycetota bacterium]